MTLGLFGFDFEHLLDDSPLVSGQHAKNLYLGTLGAEALRAAGSGNCYDPAFQIGYPKTPIFNGSRFAELFMLLAGGGYQPAAYKVGLAALCLLAPLLLIVAARGVGLGRPATVLAVVLALLVWWSRPGQDALRAGDFELPVAALAILAHVGLLVRFDRAPGVVCWLGLLATGTLGWFAQPMLFPILLPLFLLYYLTIGARHRALLWHLALWASELGGLALNSWWLFDWVAFWWLRSALSQPGLLLEHRTFQTFWHSPLWGDAADRLLALVILGSAVPGLCILQVHRERPAARLLGLGATGLLALTLLGISWQPLGQLGTSGLLMPALWFAAVPAAHAWAHGFAALKKLLGGLFRALLVVTALCLPLAFVVPHEIATLGQRCASTMPLPRGLTSEHDAIAEKLIEHTGPEARILWEDCVSARTAVRWTPLLPLLTGRAFIGGFDPDRTIEHAAIGLADATLLGRPIGLWSDTALEDYCRRYNVGWVVCLSPATIARFHACKDATRLADFPQGGALFSVRPNTRSPVLKGQAEIVHADSRHITLADVVPDNGVVVLSFHYQKGLRASPSRVQVECEPDAADPIGFLRLRLAGPVARITLTWDR